MILDFQSPAPSPQALPWYALHVKPHHEFHTRDWLVAAGIEHYLPSTFRLGWHKLKIETPVFPGYVLARNSPDRLYDVFRPSPHLLRILGDWRGPIAIPEVQIESLRIVLSQPKVEITTADLWRGGEEVEVTSGPLTGSTGFVAYVKNKARLVVSIAMLGRAACVEMDACTVRALNPVSEPGTTS